VTPGSLAKRREKGTGEKSPRNRTHLGSYVDWACLRVGCAGCQNAWADVVLCLSVRQRRLAFSGESSRGTATRRKRVARASSETSRTWATRCKFANHGVITVFGASRLARRDVPEGKPNEGRKGDINDTAVSARCRHRKPNGKRYECALKRESGGG